VTIPRMTWNAFSDSPKGIVDRVEFLAVSEFSDRGIDLVQNDKAGLIIDRAPVDGVDESDELRWLHVLDGRKHPEQLNQRGGVRTGENGLAFFAVKRFPRAQETSVVGELLLFGGAALHGAALFVWRSVLTDDEHATGLHSDPLGKATPFAKLVRAVVAVGRGDRDHDRADRVMLVGRPLAVKAVAIQLAKALHVLFDPIIVDAVGHGAAASAFSTKLIFGSTPGTGMSAVNTASAL